MAVSLFLDTNIWLHFRPIEEIDWPTVVNDPAVEVIASPILIDELDQLKDDSASKRIRDRARNALRRIEGWDQSAVTEIRPAVAARYWHPEAPPNPAALGLDSQRNDDVLLATVRAFADANPGVRTILVTDDTGPRLKARRLSLEVLAPPETARLADDTDAVDRENMDLKRRLERAASRLPRLALGFVAGIDGGKRFEVAPLRRPPTSREEAIAKALAEANQLAPDRTPPESDLPKITEARPASRGIDLATLVAPLGDGADYVGASEFRRYSEERRKYLAEVEEVAGLQWDGAERDGRSVAIAVEIRNDGTAPADDIDVLLCVPDGPQVHTENAWHRVFEIPAPPMAPRTTNEVLLESLRANFTFPGLMPPSLDHLYPTSRSAPNISAPRIERSNSYDIRYDVRQLKQHTAASLGTLVLEFPSIGEARSLTLKYRLNSATLPDPVDGTLHVVCPVRP